MSGAEHLNELAFLLGKEPSDVVFRAICSLIDTWPRDGSVGEAVAAAQEKMAAWPDGVRHIDWEWGLKELGPVLDAPSGPLVRSLETVVLPAELADALSAREALSIRCIRVFAGDDQSLQAFDPRVSLGGLTALSLQGAHIARDTLQRFLFHRLPDRLQLLELVALGDDEVWNAVHEFLCSDRGAKLREVRLAVYPDSLARALMADPPSKGSTLFRMGRLSARELAALQQSPQFASRLHTLRLGSGKLRDEGVMALAECRHLSSLEWLELRFNQIGPAGVAALVKAPFAPRLKHLDLHWNPLTDEGIATIADSDMERLESLILSKTQCSDAGAKAIAGSTGLKSLVALDLTENDVGDAGVAAIAESDALAALRSLRLGFNSFGDAVCAALADASFSKLRELDLSGTRLSPKTVAILAASKSLRELRTLDLTHCYIGDEAAVALASGSAWTSLQALDLTGTPINPWTPEALFASDFTIGDEGLRAIARSPSLGNLRVLTLAGSPGDKRGFGDRGIRALAETDTITKLVELNLVCRRISEDAMVKLANSPAMRRLDKVFLYHTGHFQPWLDAPVLRPALHAFVRHQAEEE